MIGNKICSSLAYIDPCQTKDRFDFFKDREFGVEHIVKKSLFFIVVLIGLTLDQRIGLKMTTTFEGSKIDIATSCFYLTE